MFFSLLYAHLSLILNKVYLKPFCNKDLIFSKYVYIIIIIIMSCR